MYLHLCVILILALVLSTEAKSNPESQRAVRVDRKTRAQMCNIYEFECAAMFQCVSNSQICDGKLDCQDGTDESFRMCGERMNPVHLFVSPTTIKENSPLLVICTFNISQIPDGVSQRSIHLIHSKYFDGNGTVETREVAYTDGEDFKMDYGDDLYWNTKPEEDIYFMSLRWYEADNKVSGIYQCNVEAKLSSGGTLKYTAIAEVLKAP